MDISLEIVGYIDTTLVLLPRGKQKQQEDTRKE